MIEDRVRRRQVNLAFGENDLPYMPVSICFSASPRLRLPASLGCGQSPRYGYRSFLFRRRDNPDHTSLSGELRGAKHRTNITSAIHNGIGERFHGPG